MITNTKTVKRNNGVEIVWANVTSAGVSVVSDANDSRTVLLLKNTGSASATVTIVKGNSPYGAENDLSLTVANGKELVVSLDSALYKDMPTDGYLVKTSASGVTVACVTLP